MVAISASVTTVRPLAEKTLQIDARISSAAAVWSMSATSSAAARQRVAQSNFAAVLVSLPGGSTRNVRRNSSGSNSARCIARPKRIASVSSRAPLVTWW